MKKIIVGISAADGVQIGSRLLELLQPIKDVETFLVMSRNSEVNFKFELDWTREKVCALADYSFSPEDMSAVVSSGSFHTDGMIIAPCSMKTLAAIACGYSDNLLTRAADVCLKEKRRLVLLPREMPFSLIHLKNMTLIAESGGTILPPVLTFYSDAMTVTEQIDHILGRAMMQFGISLPCLKPWSGINKQ